GRGALEADLRRGARPVPEPSHRQLHPDRHRRPRATVRHLRSRVLPGPARGDAPRGRRASDGLPPLAAAGQRGGGGPSGRAGRPSTRVEYEITVSTTLLFNTFQNVDRKVTVGGLECRDRLEALQRIFEHELLHLAEFLGWGRSNCRAGNFHALSRRIFAHEGVFHDLVTPREEAGVAYGIVAGDLVSFEHEGVRR